MNLRQLLKELEGIQDLNPDLEVIFDLAGEVERNLQIVEVTMVFDDGCVNLFLVEEPAFKGGA